LPVVMRRCQTWSPTLTEGYRLRGWRIRCWGRCFGWESGCNRRLETITQWGALWFVLL